MCGRNKRLTTTLGLILAALGLGVFICAVFPGWLVAVLLSAILITIGILIVID